MGLRTYVLIHLVDDNRLLGVMADDLPEVSIGATDVGFIYNGVMYGTYSRFDCFENAYTTELSELLLSVLTNLAGSPDNAVALVEAIEPLTSAQDKPVVTKLGDGSTQVSIPRADGAGYGLTYLRACRWGNPIVQNQLTQLAGHLLASNTASAVDGSQK